MVWLLFTFSTNYGNWLHVKYQLCSSLSSGFFCFKCSSKNVTFVIIIISFLGISRLTLPSGTKGFGGTEGFMAPEIMKYNGEEEYTEKVFLSFLWKWKINFALVL